LTTLSTRYYSWSKVEFVIVEFPDRREVLVDGIDHGFNRELNKEERILRVAEGLHRFRLRGPENYVPVWQTVEVSGTDSIEPLRVVFRKAV
jgi:hypothetical protein